MKRRTVSTSCLFPVLSRFWIKRLRVSDVLHSRTTIEHTGRVHLECQLVSSSATLESELPHATAQEGSLLAAKGRAPHVFWYSQTMQLTSAFAVVVHIDYCSFHISLSKSFWRYFFYYLFFRTETFTMCVNVLYITRNEISVGSDIKWEISP